MAPASRWAAPFVTPLAGQLPEDHPNAERLNALAGCFSLVEPLDLALVPERSMLREFLGGAVARSDALEYNETTGKNVPARGVPEKERGVWI